MNKLKIKTSLLLLFALLVAFSVTTKSQTATELTSKFVSKNSGHYINCKLLYDKEGDMIPLANAVIDIAYFNGKEFASITKIKTDAAGMASLELKDALTNFKNDTGLMQFKSSFEQFEDFDPASVEFNGMEVKIDLNFELRENPDDSLKKIKTIVGKAYAIGKNQEEIPLNGFDISFFTPSLFGLLPIGTGFLEEGLCELKFPKKLPGDSLGRIEVYARIIDNEIYGDVEFSQICDFAKKHTHFVNQHGKLWTTDPPLWMVITLFILIFGVWSHYFYIFVKMRKIFKMGKSL